MTDDVAAMVEFVRAQYADAVATAESVAKVLAAQASEGNLGLSPSAAAEQAASRVHAAWARIRFFEETVVAHLGTAGPMGRIAEQQLRLLAWEHEGHRDYQRDWAP